MGSGLSVFALYSSSRIKNLQDAFELSTWAAGNSGVINMGRRGHAIASSCPATNHSVDFFLFRKLFFSFFFPPTVDVSE